MEAVHDERVDEIVVSTFAPLSSGWLRKDVVGRLRKETGLPVKQVAKVLNFMGDETLQETTYGGYKDFDGIKKATKLSSKRDSEKYLTLELSEFKVLDKVDAKTFEEPK